MSREAKKGKGPSFINKTNSPTFFQQQQTNPRSIQSRGNGNQPVPVEMMRSPPAPSQSPPPFVFAFNHAGSRASQTDSTPLPGGTLHLLGWQPSNSNSRIPRRQNRNRNRAMGPPHPARSCHGRANHAMGSPPTPDFDIKRTAVGLSILCVFSTTDPRSQTAGGSGGMSRTHLSNPNTIMRVCVSLRAR